MKPELFEKAEDALKNYWGYESFRPGQDRVIESVLNGKNTLVLFPTGGGKSLCYQVPATVLKGLTLVISPLVALMQDQVEQLQEAGIRATFVNSSIPGFEVEQRLINARNGMYKLLYVSPERLETPLWEQMLPDLNIEMLAVDEAHCISQWGHDFRPSYRNIRPALERLPDKTRWMALTATATPEVRDDILANLQFEDPEIVASGFERSNLMWWVTHAEQKKKQAQKAVSRAARKGSGIVYAGTRNQCEKLARDFSRLEIASKAYHAGMTSEERSEVQKGWISGKFPVVVATNAFGMGIDKADCRFVLHYEMPYTLEAYYQEAGRAGRDGLKAYPILLYRESDYHKAKSRILRSYPDYDTLQKVYDALCDQLNLAVGSEQEETEPVEISAVAKRMSLSPGVVESCLRVLERLEVIEILQRSDPQLGIQFAVNEEVMREFISNTKPAKAEFLDRLFRQFGPMAFRKIYYLDLPYLKTKLQVDRNSLLKAVKVFAEQDHLLVYHFIDDEPMVRLLEHRQSSIPAAKEDAEHYRKVLLKKLEYMKRYAETDLCREQYLRNYFGESDTKPCGHCDNCTSDRSISELDNKEISMLKEELSQGPQTLSSLANRTKISSDKLKRILRLLIREEKVKKSESASGGYIWIQS